MCCITTSTCVAQPDVYSRANATPESERRMNNTIYIRVRHPDNGVRVADELISLGIPRDRVHVYARRIPAGLPVQTTRWRSRDQTRMAAAVVGAVSLPLLVGLLLGGSDAVTTLVLALLGAAAGLLSARAWSRRAHVDFGIQEEALKRGELMIVAELDQSKVQDIETRIAERHPEVMVLGSDPAGSPPFP